MATPQTIEDLGELCVARGCGFAALAIATFMVGLSWDMVLAAKVGGVLVLFVSVILLGKAQRALSRRVQTTELWLMLDRDERLDVGNAQRIVGAVLRGCYLRFALHAASLSIALLTLSLWLGLARTPSDQAAFDRPANYRQSAVEK